MNNCCGPLNIEDNRFQKVIRIALLLNFSMFIIEIITSLIAHSSSLKADSLDFLGDSANYIISLYVIKKSFETKSKASLIKGVTMSLFSLWVLFDVGMNLTSGAFPKAEIMGWTGGLALLVNTSVALMLYRFRSGDSNMQSVWLCSRNDAIGNVAVILAALSVNYLNSVWPDLIVALLMALLSGVAGFKIIKLAMHELKHGAKAKTETKTCCG